MSASPTVTIVTPSLNMATYVERTIKSVLDQDYDDIEYIVMDGGSTDGTKEILARYGHLLQFESRSDNGPGDAINRGYERSHGEFFAYLNADDTYLPGAIRTAVEYLLENPQVAVVYGNGFWVDSDDHVICPYPTRDFDPGLLARECYICQPATLMRSEVFARVGMMNPELHYTFDYDLWIRIAKQYAFGRLERFLATSRMHPSNKTIGAKGKVLRETIRLLRHHYGYVPYQWVYAYACWLLDRKNQFFEQSLPSVPKFFLSVLLGARYNVFHPARFYGEVVSATRR